MDKPGRVIVQVIDSEGYRANVGIVLSNSRGQVFWARRIGQDAWQFPQGGIRPHETPEQALYRELTEEVGLCARHVRVMACTRRWLRYRLPANLVRRDSKPLCIGQKQRWFLLQLVGNEGDVCLDASEQPEFDHWRWVDFWHPLREVVAFKKDVYRRALREFEPLVFPPNRPRRRGRSRGMRYLRG